jgi:hypothetical protein
MRCLRPGQEQVSEKIKEQQASDGEQRIRPPGEQEHPGERETENSGPAQRV